MVLGQVGRQTVMTNVLRMVQNGTKMNENIATIQNQNMAVMNVMALLQNPLNAIQVHYFSNYFFILWLFLKRCQKDTRL